MDIESGQSGGVDQQQRRSKNGVVKSHGSSKDKDLRKTSIDSDSGMPPSAHLLANVAKDYSQYLRTDLSFQITKVEEFVVESVAKLEEFQSLFEMKDSERRAWSSQILPDVIRTGTLLSITLNQRLDTLTSLMLSIQAVLDTLETQIAQAETKFGMPSPISSTSTAAIRSVFNKYFTKGEDQGGEQNVLPKSKRICPPSAEQLKGPNPLELTQFFHM